ncbi:metallophosphoesterase [candidate division KSB1 bacterium]|nr:metallophosphoesterase [candidate division KSB1 bacterium]
MKQAGFIIFFTTVLTVYALVNFYIVRRGLQALPAGSPAKSIFFGLMLLLILTYPLGRICEKCLSAGFGAVLITIGSYYLAIMIFAFLILLCIDLLRLIDAVIPFIGDLWNRPMPRLRLITFVVTTALVLALTLISAVNARYLRLRILPVQIDKPCKKSPLRLVMFSDMHLGTLIHAGRMRKLAGLINAQSPDVVLIAGDLFDEDAVSLSEKNMCDALRRLKAPLGIFAIPGNHEYYGGIESAAQLMEKSGITVLRDHAVKVADAFYIIGREDRTLSQFGGSRASLKSLVAGLDASLPLILLDHQPFRLEEAEKHGIDLQLSGHTHHGQIFPFNLITDLVYEVSWGYKRKGSTHVYVSSGAGTWGPPVRLGNTPECVVIECTFTHSRVGN